MLGFKLARSSTFGLSFAKLFPKVLLMTHKPCRQILNLSQKACRFYNRYEKIPVRLRMKATHFF